jgi:AraC-like DNA-binding protein
MVYCINFLIDEEIDTIPFKLHIKNVDNLKQDFVKAATAWKKKGISYEETCRACLYKIIADCKIVYTKPYKHSKQIKMLEPALQFIQNEFCSQTISIPMLAELCGISETYFRKLFLLEFGISPSKYIRNKRLMLARDLLNSGEFSVTDAAITSGFNDISYFSREYKKLWDVSPSAK